MTMIDLETIRGELANDPLGLGYAALVEVANDQALAAMLNEKNRPGRRVNKRWEIKKFLIGTGTYAKLYFLREDVNQNPTVRGLAISALAWIDDTGIVDVDVDLAETQTLINGLHAATIIDDAVKTAFLALADTDISRVEELGAIGDTITAEQVGGCR